MREKRNNSRRSDLLGIARVEGGRAYDEAHLFGSCGDSVVDGIGHARYGRSKRQ